MILLFISPKKIFALCNTFGKGFRSNPEKKFVCNSCKVELEFYLIYWFATLVKLEMNSI